MSTEHQRYSTERQAAAIARYAAKHRHEIVRTYTDSGISGLTLSHRKALQALLADVVGGEPGFDVILVYDVSRWGRFQNPDQSAHYEFLCQEAGVSVEYCEEPFTNDGSMGSMILKSLKRVMAAQDSRDFSIVVSAAQKAGARKGFWQGGPPGYGLRRQMVDEHGRAGLILQAGEAKAIQSHRVILVPGPPEEVEVVRRIYWLFAVTGMKRNAIARALNEDGVTAELGRPWTFERVHEVLTNEKYVGNLISSRWKTELGGRRRHAPKSDWVRTPGAFEPVVERHLFERAQEALAQRAARMKPEAMLDALRELLEEHGGLSKHIIDHAPGVPSAHSYVKRFGSLRGAYNLIGYTTRRIVRRTVRIWSDEDLLRRLSRILHEHGELSGYLIDQDPTGPCADTYIDRFGSLRQAYARVGYVRVSIKERASPVGRARAEALRLRAQRDATSNQTGLNAIPGATPEDEGAG